MLRFCDRNLNNMNPVFHSNQDVKMIESPVILITDEQEYRFESGDELANQEFEKKEVNMKDSDYYFSVTPSIVQVGKETTVTIKVLDDLYNFKPECDYIVRIYPLTTHTWQDTSVIYTCTPKDNSISFTHTFDKVQEYFLRLSRTGGSHSIIQLNMYALDSDLYALEPLKGDTHVHTTRSDGRETPGLVCANYRSKGFDFMTVTDHYNYYGSAEMIDSYKDVKLGMTLLYGEEVHSPGNFVHIVNLGSSASVNDICQKNREQYEKEVNDIIATEDIPYHTEPFTYAACLWVARKSKELGGLPIFCHPFWLEDVYNVPTELAELLIKSGEFEAFELIGGQSTFENNMQTIFYSDMLRKGIDIPCVGGSDSHGTVNRGLFNMIYSIVFAKSREPEDIKDAIRNGQVAAVETYEGTSVYSVHGKGRYANLALFLLEHYFPHTEEMTAEEGFYMKKYVKGDRSVSEHISSISDRVSKYCKEYYGR